MKVATWNVNHRAAERIIRPSMAGAIAALDADAVVLTEWVPGPSRADFLEALRAHGLRHTLQSALVPGQNHVLIASRTPLVAGALRAPRIHPWVPSNFLHVRVPAHKIEILGIRVPDFGKEPPLKRKCWDWIEEMAASTRRRPVVMLGDFNTDAHYPRSRCGDRLGQLVENGWQHAAPARGASFWTLRGEPKRVDHAFVSAHFKVKGARYIAQLGRHIYAGKEGSMSDHAVLVVDIAAKRRTATRASPNARSRPESRFNPRPGP